MKKVLFVATVTKHINAFHIPYLKWFKEQGYEVHVASNGEEKIEYCDKHYNLPFERFPIKKNNIKTYRELKKIINENNYEIVHCHTPVGGVLARLAAKQARKNGTRVIYTAHGFHFYKGAPILNWIIYYPIEKYLSKFTDCLITINKEDYELAKRKFKVKQIELVHGVGVDESKFDFYMSQDEKYEFRNSLGLQKEDFVIIYVAELSKRKNQKMLIKSVKKLIDKGHKIKVLLPGSDSLNGYYQRICQELNIEKNIMFLGHRKDIPKLLKISNLYVSTSKQEGLPVNIMEAMICGLPIIATNCRGNNDLINSEYLITNQFELTEKVYKILKRTINKTTENNFKYVKPYLLENVIKEMKKLYQLE